MKAIICGALMALTIMPVHAAENAASAGYMLPPCKASLDYPPGTFIQGFCAGIVVGVAAMVQPLFAPGQSRAAERCVDIPESTTNRQFVQVVVRYIEAQPNRLNEQFRVLVVEALFDAWPCKK
jgi:hypothetical protein